MSHRTIAEEVEHRLEFERLVLGISTAFINLNTNEIDAGIEHALARIGTFCEVDRAYVFSLGEQFMSNTHEWCAPGVEPQIDNLKALPVSVFPWWVGRVLQKEVIHIPVVALLPDEASAEREILEAQDIVSIVVVPLVFGGKALGFIGFDSIHEGKAWTEEDITLLRIAGEIVVNALERKRAEIERSTLEDQLIQARSFENVARLAGGVAHDFNNLLMVITSHARALKRGCTDPALENAANVLNEAAEQAAELTRQLMIVGKREALPSEVLDVNAVLTSLEALLESSLGESVQLNLKLDREPCWVRLAKAHLKQVIVNLAVNARDALPSGGHVSIETWSQASGKPGAPEGGAGAFVCLRVQDDGVGMSDEVKRRAFEPFFSTKGTLGTGLGLSTLYSIVEHAGGHTQLDSKSGAGTAVTIYLPRVAAPRTPPPPAPAPAGPHGQNEQILLVEDSDAVRDLLEHLLAEHGYRVATAGHPNLALALASTELRGIDLLLTDVILPVMSGRALAEQLKARFPRLRVAYISGQDDQVLARQGLIEEGVWLLPKPFRDDQLLTFVRAVLDAPEGATQAGGVVSARNA